MKKIIILFLLGWGVGFGQINLTGSTIYEMNILGFQGRDQNACGDIDGLKRIRATYANGNTEDIYNGRKINQAVDEIRQYSKSNPIVNLEFYKVLRYSGCEYCGCNSGPYDEYNNVGLNNLCFKSYQEDAGTALRYLTVTSRPKVSFTFPTISNLYYLDELERLTISLPDNLTPNHYKWKYKIADGNPQDIPAEFNNSSLLTLKGGDFLNSTDYGKIIEVYLEMNCDAGYELAIAKARISAFEQSIAVRNNCINNCNGNFFCFINCINNTTFNNNFNNFFNTNFNQALITQYQSLKSTNSLFFTYLKAAPRIVSITTNQPKCFESNDGSVSIKFDRQLEQNSNELLSLDFEGGVFSDISNLTQLAVTRLQIPYNSANYFF